MPGIIGTKEMLERVRDLKEQTVMNGFNKTEDVDKFFSENWMHLLDILDDALSEYLVDDEPQTMYYPQVDGITPSVIEPKFDKDINVRSKYKQGTWLYGDGVYCSCCGYKLETTALLAKCPKCGADMSKTDCAWK